MPYVLVNAHDQPDPDSEGCYLAAYDVDHRPDGRAVYPCGRAEWTHDLNEALTFDRPGDAFAVWQEQSRLVPYRPDGEPNRPLTAFTVEVRNPERESAWPDGLPSRGDRA